MEPAVWRGCAKGARRGPSWVMGQEPSPGSSCTTSRNAAACSLGFWITGEDSRPLCFLCFFYSLSDLGVADPGQRPAFPLAMVALTRAWNAPTCVLVPDVCYCWRASATSRVTPSVDSPTRKAPCEPPGGVTYSAERPAPCPPHACWCSCWAPCLDCADLARAPPAFSGFLGWE